MSAVSKLQRLQGAFSDTPREVLQLQLQRNRGNAVKTFADLMRWSPEELKQPLEDEAGHEIFTWRVPLKQCQ